MVKNICFDKIIIKDLIGYVVSTLEKFTYKNNTKVMLFSLFPIPMNSLRKFRNLECEANII